MYKYFFSFLGVILLVLSLINNVKATIDNNQNEVSKQLEKNKTISGALRPGEMDEYLLHLNKNTYLEVTVKCIGIDIKIELVSPTNEVVNRVNENSINETEKLIDVVEEAGDYKVRVVSMDKKSPSGQYVIELKDIKTVEINEFYSQRILARKTFMAAEKIYESDGGSEEANIELCKQAISKYSEAMNLYKGVQDINRFCEILNKISDIYVTYLYKLPDSYEKALNNDLLCLKLYKEINDDYGQALQLHNIGYILSMQNKNEEAIDSYNKCNAICKEILHDNYEAALSTYNIAFVLTKQNKLEEALNTYVDALKLAESAKFFNFCTSICNELLYRYQQNDNKRKILETYDKKVYYCKLLEDKKLIADCLNDKAEFCKKIYNEEEALKSYLESLKFYKELGDKNSEAIILNNIGSLYDQYGEVYKALEYYQIALPLAKSLNNNDLVSSLLNNIGLAYSSIRDYEKAISALGESLNLVSKDEYRIVRLSNLGSTYSSFGDSTTSLLYYEEALTISRKIKDEKSEAILVNNIAIEQLNDGNNDKAKENLFIALEKFRNTKNKKGEATTLTKLADIELKSGKGENAKSLLEEALKIRNEIEDKVGEVYTRNLLGIVQNILGDSKSAIANFEKALLLSQDFYDQKGNLITLYNLSAFQKQHGDLIESLKTIQGAISKIEGTRSNFISRTFQSSYFATNQKYYELCIEILMSLHRLDPKQNYDVKAFEVSERMRARNLLDLVNSTSDVGNFATFNSDDFKAREEVERQLSFLAVQLIKLKSDTTKKEELNNIEEKFAKTKNKLELIETEIRSKRSNTNSSNPFTPLTLQQTQKDVLDGDSALIQYFLGEENSYVWLITNTNAFVFTLSPREKIENLVDKVYSKLIERNNNVTFESKDERVLRIKKADSEYLKLNSELSQILLDPLKEHLKNKNKLLVSADGKLYFLPFGALVFAEDQKSASSTFLLEKYEITNIPSASTIALIRQKGQQELKGDRVLVLADPVFGLDDDRVSLNEAAKHDKSSKAARPKVRGVRGLSFERLPGSEKESVSIGKTFPNVDELTGLKATKQAIISNDLRKYRYIHFATHSLADTVQPELSAVVLSLVDEHGKEQDGFVTVGDIVKLNISTDLITLSSCETALGKEKKGEGVIGLTRAFFYAGAKRVVSTLWSVADESTSELMINFYQNIKTGSTPSSALRAAQLELLKNIKYKAPYYWAPFQIQGEYK